MALETPTTAEIRANIVAQLEAALNQTIPLLPKAFNRVLAAAIAGVFVTLFKFGGFSWLQIFVRYASDKPTEVNGRTVVPLDEWGRLVGVTRTAATKAEMTADVTVDTQIGTLPTGTPSLGESNGFTYLTIGAVALDAPVVSVTIRASADQAGGGGAGALGNLEPGAIVSFANPLANVQKNMVITGTVVTAANQESVEAFRQRIQDKFQKRPQGGAYADYELWGEEAAGIINIYPYTSEDGGEVNVYAEATPASSGSPDGIPTAAQLQAVQDIIELDQNGLATRRPAGAFVNALPITRTAFTGKIYGLNVPDPVQTTADLISAVETAVFAAEPFIPGLSVPPRKDNISEAALGGIVAGIVAAAGGTFASFQLELSGAPIGLYILGEGEKAKITVSVV